MKIQRNSEHDIIVTKDDIEIHPFLSVLAAIEMQQKIIPPRIPELNDQGWNTIVQALKLAVDNLPEPGESVAEPETVSAHESVPFEDVESVAKTDTGAISIVKKPPVKPTAKTVR